MNPLMRWVGGKKELAKTIVTLPPAHTCCMAPTARVQQPGCRLDNSLATQENQS